MASVHCILVSYNTKERTLETLDHLKRHTGLDYHITVIDNGSKDGSVSALRRWEREGRERNLLVNSKNLGFAKAVNQGLQLTGIREHSCLINSDLLVSPGWALRLIAHFQDTEKVGIVGPIGRGIGGFQDYSRFYGELPPDHLYRAWLSSFSQRLYEKQKGLFRTAKYLIGCCMMISFEALEEVGYLDEAFFGGADDLDYSIRARLKGFDLVVAHDVFVWHHIQASFSALKEETFKRIRDDCWSHFNQKWKHVFPPNSWNRHFVSEEEIEYPPFRLIKNF